MTPSCNLTLVISSLRRVSVLTWAAPIWRVWAENSARHSTSPPWRSESAAPRGTTLPRNPPDCQRVGTADSSKGPLGYCVVLGPTALPCPNQYEKPLLSTFSLNSQSQTTLLNGVNWLDDSWIVSPSFFFYFFFYSFKFFGFVFNSNFLFLFFFNIPEYCGLVHPFCYLSVYIIP